MGITVLLVSGQGLLREGLTRLLADDGFADVVSVATPERLGALSRVDTDVALVDATDGIDGAAQAIAELKREGAQAPAIVLGADSDEAFLRLLSEGARGFVDRAAGVEALRRAIGDVLQGRLAIGDRQAELLAREFVRRRDDTKPPPGRPEMVTQREIQILQLLAEGMTNAGIARRLVLSENTIRAHIRSIVVKLDAENRVQAVARAIELGLLSSRPPGDTTAQQRPA
jgi:DNA-binding NarL/FixJ family response regulator